MEQRLKSQASEKECGLPAFSLVELLVVIAIISLLAVLGTTAFSDLSRSTKLSAAGHLLQSEISLARQQAVTFHQEVEVRFFQTERLGVREWNAIQIVVADSSGAAKSLRKPSLLPDGVAMDEERSALLRSAPISDSTNFGRHGIQAYRAFRFRSGGNTQPELTATNNSLMLVTVTPGQTNSQPANFIALVVSPVNGRTTTYQP